MTITREHPRLRLSVLPGLFYVCKVQEVPADVLRRIVEEPQTLLSITRTADEISIVGQCSSDNESQGEWRCIKIAGPMPFELTGILHGLLEPLKRAEIGIFALSTWNTDYCLIPKDKVSDAVEALQIDGWLVDESAADIGSQRPEHRDDKVDTIPSQLIGYSPRLPQELVNLVIDNVSDRHTDRIVAFRNPAPLRACSLVAKGWLKGAQRRIFEWIELPDMTTLYRLVDTLRASPHLAGYVEVLSLSRRGGNAYMGYAPGCVEVLSPSVLGGLLPKLRCVAIDIRSVGTWSLLQVKRDNRGQIEAVLRHTSRPFFQCLPIHPRFPLRLSAFASLEELDLGFVVFQNFYDFARTLYDFERLRSLHCGNVSCVNPGVVLPSFMAPAEPRRRRRAFLPHLERLSMVTVGEHGAERLLAGLALTASLRRFTVTMTNELMRDHALNTAATGGRSVLDLSPFPRLVDLSVLDITPDVSGPIQLIALPVLRDMLEFWNAGPAPRSLSLWIKPGRTGPMSTGPARKRDFFAFLAEVRRTVEEACTFRPRSTIPELWIYLEIPQDGRGALGEVEREAVARFPLTSKAGQLHLDVYTSDHDYFSWERTTVGPSAPNCPQSPPRLIPVLSLGLERCA